MTWPGARRAVGVQRAARAGGCADQAAAPERAPRAGGLRACATLRPVLHPETRWAPPPARLEQTQPHPGEPSRCPEASLHSPRSAIGPALSWGEDSEVDVGWSTAQGRWVCGNPCRRRARLSEAPTHGRLHDGGSARRTRRRQPSAGVRGARCSKRILDLTLSTEDGLIGVQSERESRSIRVPKAATSPSASRHLGAQTVASWG